jgi:hypothetical protein
LIPKKFVKGVPQCPVKIPSDRITRRTREEEQALLPSKPTPTVSISAKSTLVRATVTDPEPAKIQEENEEQSELATAPVGSRGRGRGRVPDSGTWRRAIESVTPKEEVKPEQVEDAKPVEIESKATEEVPRGAAAASAALKSKLPVGSSIGFYRSAVGETDTSAPKDRSAEVAKSFMVTSELNGEKIAATPREETTAPGIDLAARSKVSRGPRVSMEVDTDDLDLADDAELTTFQTERCRKRSRFAFCRLDEQITRPLGPRSYGFFGLVSNPCRLDCTRSNDQ